MEYLDKVLGVKVTYEDVEFKHLPNFIATRYRLQMVSMNEQKAVFIYPKTELEQIEVLKKHIARIQKNENLPVVLVLKELSYRQKEYLIREKIPFIVDGKQIYLPFAEAEYLRRSQRYEIIGPSPPPAAPKLHISERPRGNPGRELPRLPCGPGANRGIRAGYPQPPHCQSRRPHSAPWRA